MMSYARRSHARSPVTAYRPVAGTNSRLMRSQAGGATPVTVAEMPEPMLAEALAAIDEAIGRFGAELLPAEGQVMTQCNAGALATAGIGTALGVIRVAHEQGKKLHVLVPETRPYLQGARLTAWELHEDGIPLTLITDNMAGHLMAHAEIDAVGVGAGSRDTPGAPVR